MPRTTLTSHRTAPRVAAGLGFLASLALLSSLAGCGDGVHLEDLSGTATFGGKPIAYGQINFVPDTAKNHSGPAGTAEIIDGHYDTALGGKGVVPGPHLVRISAYEERPSESGDNELLPSTAKPPLFSGYPLEMELSGGTQDFEVPPSAKGFDMFKGPPKQAGNAP